MTTADQLQIGILSTYPPRLCGLATFAAALESALQAGGDRVTVVQIDDGDRSDLRPLAPRATLVNGQPASVRAAAALLSTCDVAIVQHEYGIYGGRDGDEVVDVLSALEVPAIVVLHTVLAAPTAHQRSVLEAVCSLAERVVVMGDAAGARLVSTCRVDASRVITIPHGATAPVGHRVAPAAAASHPNLLTWGLLGPGKGIEHAIGALAHLRDLQPGLRYTVAGVTHPKVRALHGDAYRRSLMQQAASLGVERAVRFDGTYRDLPSLVQVVAAATLVVLPYDSLDQATSGVLVDAIAAGRPVVATAFPHAVELLGSGAGIVVPHRDPRALAGAIRTALTEPGRLEAMGAEAARLAPTLGWPSVARRYHALCDRIVRRERTLIG